MTLALYSPLAPMEGSLFHIIWSGRWELLIEAHSGCANNNLVYEERKPLRSDQHHNEPIFVYRRRWLILFVFMFLSLVNNLTTYTFSSIAVWTQEYYEVSALKVNLLALVFFISGLTFRFLAMWTIDSIGLSLGVILAALLNVAGNWVRIFPGIKPDGYYWVLLGQCICAVGQAFVDIAAPKLAANWFPPNQRTTATAFGYLPLFSSLLLSEIFGPLVVTGPHASQFLRLELVQAIASSFAGMLVVLFFRGKPPLPPSASAREEKMKFLEGLLHLRRNKSFWFITGVLCSAGGAALTFSIMLNEIVVPAGYTTDNGGLFGSLWVGCAALSAVVSGPLTDYIGSYKKLVLPLAMPAAVSSIVFAFFIAQVIPHCVWGAALSCAVIGVSGGVIPAVFEAAVETAYPVPEATVMGILFLGLNIVTISGVLGLTMLKAHQGNLIVGTFIIATMTMMSILLMLLYREDNRRKKFEQQVARSEADIQSTPVK